MSMHFRKILFVTLLNCGSIGFCKFSRIGYIITSLQNNTEFAIAKTNFQLYFCFFHFSAISKMKIFEKQLCKHLSEIKARYQNLFVSWFEKFKNNSSYGRSFATQDFFLQHKIIKRTFCKSLGVVYFDQWMLATHRVQNYEKRFKIIIKHFLSCIWKAHVNTIVKRVKNTPWTIGEWH